MLLFNEDEDDDAIERTAAPFERFVVRSGDALGSEHAGKLVLALSTVAAWSLASIVSTRLAHLPRSLLFGSSALEQATLAAGLHLCRRWAPTSVPTRSSAKMRLAMIALVLWSSSIASLFQARWIALPLFQALESLHVLVAIVFASAGSKAFQAEERESVIAAASVALTIVSIIGLPASTGGIALVLAKAISDGIRLVTIKTWITHGALDEMVIVSLASAFIGSVAFSFEAFARSRDGSPWPLLSTAMLTVFEWTALSVATTMLIICALSVYHSFHTTLSLVFARNVMSSILLTCSTLSSSNASIQTTVVSLVATVASFMASDDLCPSKPSWSSFSHRTKSLALVLPATLFFLLYITNWAARDRSSDYWPVSMNSMFLDDSLPKGTVDIVFSYYDEPLDTFKQVHNRLRNLEFVWSRATTVIVYNKGPKLAEEIKNALELREHDQVVQLDNLGREGATYLSHIVAHYNATLERAQHSSIMTRKRPLADHTFLLQPHLAWDFIAIPRLSQLDQSTGFAHLGPLLRTGCGEDGRGTGRYELVRDIFNIFAGHVCSAEQGQLSAWSGQFVVSRQRIMANPYSSYSHLLEIMTAPADHWIHRMWGPSGTGTPDNPAAGHSLERSWPIIFGCTDPTIADRCPDDEYERTKCQCLDL